ncbi:hypothetical protein [Exiguobacterium sp. s59]|uniref:hypothetical protein n=1 Tax=Exiguobacterium sp. s59 TaxID=2751269 RepID=UPI001BE68A5A|nr:hypothetical protein [Exiguobacterium sp. s59]
MIQKREQAIKARHQEMAGLTFLQNGFVCLAFGKRGRKKAECDFYLSQYLDETSP